MFSSSAERLATSHLRMTQMLIAHIPEIQISFTLTPPHADFDMTNVFMLAVETGRCYLAESSTR